MNPITGQEESNVWTVYEDRQKRLWASTTNPGCLYLFNRTANRFQLFDNRITDLQSLMQTTDGQLWGGNYTDLIQIDQVNKKHHFFKIGYPVRSLLED
ncbi:MAG: hypothetical protein EOP49_35005 [Sphingobacteriales bacterium]|nr:MAG: hypothetical protein EOP49_35005 [Sphingobacteriales bacterium]